MGITITAQPGRVTVREGGRVLADTRAALALREGARPPVLYLPRADVAMDLLRPTATRTTCPHKGEARYFGTGGRADVAWSYEAPFAAVAAIAGHLAFYPDRVEAIETTA